MRRLLATVAATALFLCPNTSAQSVNAIVSGKVTDVTGALLPGVTLTATNIETGVITTTLSNRTGAYRFPSLRPGIYTISASLQGFLTQPYTDLEFSAQPYNDISFTLPLASVITPGVEVQAMPMDATPSKTGISKYCAAAIPMKAMNSPSRAAVSSNRIVKTLGSLLRRTASM